MQNFVEICGWFWTVFALVLMGAIAVAILFDGKNMKKMIEEDKSQSEEVPDIYI